MTDAQLLACSLSRWGGDRSRCRWCDDALRGRRRRWCSDECVWEFLRNHAWSVARTAALRRDEGCVVCGRTDGQVVEDLGRERRAMLEVHHAAERANGRHGESGCHHHLEGLRTLCRVPGGRAEKGCHAMEHGGRPVLGRQLVLDEAPIYE